MSDDVVRDALAEFIAELTPIGTPVAASGYGVDILCFDDFTPLIAETDPTSLAFQSLAQDLYHRLIQAQGENPDDLDAGLGLEGRLSQGTTDADVTRLSGDIVAEFKKDDRVAEVAPTVTLNRLVTPCTLSVTIIVTPADPDETTFKLILSVSPQGAFLQAVEAA